LSLRELARRTELTASFLSQVERGQANASIDSLRRIAEALEVPILYFLAEHPTAGPTPVEPSPSSPPAPAPAYTPVVRVAERPRLTLPVSGVAYELLTPDLGRKMEAMCGRLAPGTGNVARRLRIPTEEFIYVLSGALLIGLDSGEYILHAGDTIYFEGPTLRQLACASETEEAVWISIITPPVF
jgi:quercetin dioxygenase-like cupin family protein